MSIAEAIAALEAALLCSRSKAVRDLAGLVLGKLAGWVEVDSEGGQSVSTLPEETGNAARCRRYRVEKERKRHAGQHGRDMGSDMGGDMVAPLFSSRIDSPPKSEIPSESSMSTGAGATPSDMPSGTHRVQQHAQQHGDHQRVIDAFAQEYERVRGCKPSIGAKGGAGAKALLRGRTADEAIAIVRRAFEDPFVADKKPDLAFIASNVNAYQGTAPAKRGGPALQPVPTTGRVWKVGQ